MLAQTRCLAAACEKVSCRFGFKPSRWRTWKISTDLPEKIYGLEPQINSPTVYTVTEKKNHFEPQPPFWIFVCLPEGHFCRVKKNGAFHGNSPLRWSISVSHIQLRPCQQTCDSFHFEDLTNSSDTKKMQQNYGRSSGPFENSTAQSLDAVQPSITSTHYSLTLSTFIYHPKKNLTNILQVKPQHQDTNKIP